MQAEEVRSHATVDGKAIVRSSVRYEEGIQDVISVNGIKHSYGEKERYDNISTIPSHPSYSHYSKCQTLEIMPETICLGLYKL